MNEKTVTLENKREEEGGMENSVPLKKWIITIEMDFRFYLQIETQDIDRYIYRPLNFPLYISITLNQI